MFRFDSVNLSEVGPFADRVELKFCPGISNIVAGNGLGKTTIFNLLRDEISGSSQRVKWNGDNQEPAKAEWLVFLGERDSLSETGPRKQLLQFLDSVDTGENWLRSLEVEVTKTFLALTQHRHDALVVRIGRDGAITVHLGTSTEIGHLAVGESILLNFAVNRSIRTMQRLDLPLVCDSIFGALDSNYRELLARAIKSLDSQVILLCGEIEGVKKIIPAPHYIRERSRRSVVMPA